ncbi:hypothetical protein [Massilia eburnea]|uniref:hypothetical protein n=1 Tax=Massilia eburnea TaxID=1776165 RepID=UPI003D6A4930
MRLISTVQPRPIAGLAQIELDRLEIVPCTTTGGVEDGCLLVRHFNFYRKKVEGDNFFTSLQEALQYAYEVYEVKPSEWQLDEVDGAFQDTQEMYNHLITNRNP